MHPILKPAFAPRPTRRGFLTGSAGLVLGLHIVGKARAQSAATADGDFAPNAFIRIAPDNTVTVLVKHIEIGQGANTGLPLLVAEELDADWSQMRAEQAPSDPVVYVNTAFGVQGTGGSTGLSNSYMTMRQAGAAARAMLVSAAADRWGVLPEGITVSKGVVSHADSGNSATFGDLADAAALTPVPVDVALKDPKDFTLIGGDKVTRLDGHAKSTGQAMFTIDVFRDDMEVVSVVHPPKFGATVASFNAATALARPGVTAVRELSSGVAIYADDTYSAFKARADLDIEWDESGAETRSTDAIIEEFTAAARAPAMVAEQTGDVDAALAGADRTIEADYVFPYLAHAALEPMDGVIELRDDGAEIWSGIQIPTIAEPVIAGTLGIDPATLTVNTMYTGGSFGRRSTPVSHFEKELAEVAAKAGPGAYKLLWTREDDMTGGYYRPLTVHHLRAGLDAAGNITGWLNTIANQSIVAGTPFEPMVMPEGMDPTAIEGSRDMAYDWPANRVSWAQMKNPVPVLWWRSVGHTHTAYATETFLDQALLAGGKDTVQGRLDLLKSDRPRDRAVLERVAEMANWSGPGTGDRRMGVALHRSFGSYVAQIAEVEDRGGLPHVTRVWCAVDCGVAVTPDVVRAQMEGGIGYGLGTTLFDEITMAEGGLVQQRNYDSYRMLALPEMPQIEVSIIASSESPTGVGEPGTPPIAPAVSNAWRALTGAMPYRLPYRANSV
ncbi:xanthine dehydrogenase family protein molybdopterin-binding subunit [Jannaschia donghaensis]|uniref:Isoquinoline 1-oxidoreductase subunit beta n=1 Tax=Jannaschia donghaensis TaxID=420998 RepID=A0A0M6YQA2_9RHOB|nr:xanthine dehydrogenase family protein molybdopterin-binding subunit [Jannaschia donghaensis]CTQ51427.1 Isoquinoline 1-oxidoreductase subunit beta [Jannaschia donghaensis]